jgi:DNA-directed RNA polymerase specialized sigma24 family protein
VVITSTSDDAVWRELLSRVKALLGSRGVDTQTAEDISQEVAARALARGVAYESVDDLMAWAGTVATRLAIDDWRRGRRTQPDGIEMERPGTADVDKEAIHRVQLDEVTAGMRQLSPVQREAIVSAVTGLVPRDRAETVRLAVSRHRARRRLVAWTDGIACALARARVRLRSWFDASQPTFVGLMPYVAAVGLVIPLSSAPVPRSVQQARVVVLAPPVPSVGVRSLASPAPPVVVRTAVKPPTPIPHREAVATMATLPRPDGGTFVVTNRATRSDDALVCVGNIAGVPQTCFGKPLEPLP